MKTSNKILTGTYLIILLITIVAMAFVKNGTTERIPLEPIGEKTTRNVNFEYKNLRAIDIAVGNVTLIQQEGPAHLEINCTENIRQHLVQEFEDNEFYLGMDQDENDNLDIDVIVYVQDIESITLSGRATLKNNGSFKSDSLSIKTYSASKLEMDVAIDFLQLKTVNASKVNLKGSATLFEVNAYNAGRIEAESLVAKEVIANAGNAGVINIHASEKLSATINNNGRVYYLGQPQILKNSVNSNGRLKSINPVQ